MILTIKELHCGPSSWNFWDFEKLFWLATSKVIAKAKNLFKVGINVTNIASVDAIWMFIGNDLKSQKSSPGGVLRKKVFVKILQNSLKNICVGFLFLIQAGGLQLYWRETPVMVLFCEFYKIFKNILETSVSEE